MQAAEALLRSRVPQGGVFVTKSAIGCRGVGLCRVSLVPLYAPDFFNIKNDVGKPYTTLHPYTNCLPRCQKAGCYEAPLKHRSGLLHITKSASTYPVQECRP